MPLLGFAILGVIVVAGGRHHFFFRLGVPTGAPLVIGVRGKSASLVYIRLGVAGG